MRRPLGKGVRRCRSSWIRLAAVLAVAGTAAAGCDDEDGFVVTSGGTPVITLLEVPAQVNPGGAFLVNVGAVARRGVAGIEVRLSGAYSDTTTFEFDPVRLDTVPVSFTVTVPDTVTGLLIRVEAVATDALGRVSRTEARNINVLNQSALAAAAEALLARLRQVDGGSSVGSVRVAPVPPAAHTAAYAPRAGPPGGT